MRLWHLFRHLTPAPCRDMKIATWNVNSIRARLPNVLKWLETRQPDVVLLQELKAISQDFPHEAISDIGYNAAVVGQKARNGVAVLSKSPIDIDQTGLPGDPEDTQARYIEVFTCGVRVASLYLPNGNAPPGDAAAEGKYAYKLAWMRRLIDHARSLLDHEETVVLGGDYNVCPTDDDVHDPALWAGDALTRDETRALFRELVWSGYTEAYATLHPTTAGAWTFWDYQGGAWPKDHGVRIDHMLLSPHAADRLVASEIDRTPRAWPKASDHTPLLCELDD